MRIGVMIGSFDPISKQTIACARKEMKCQHLSLVLYVSEKQGILDQRNREKLVQKAIRPYRRMRIASKREADRALKRNAVLLNCDASDIEQQIRKGSYKNAAAGIGKELLQNGFYFEEIAEAHCSAHRYAHVKAMSALAVDLAKHSGVNPDKAWQAGMMHDITKRMNHSEAEQIMQNWYPQYLHLSENIWHSYTAVIWLRENLGMRDKDILHAVEHHTLGDGRTRLDRILFVADKTDPTRGYDAEKELNLCRRNLKRGTEIVKAEVKEYLQQKEGICVENTDSCTETA